MQTIALDDLHRFLIQEACLHTLTWLRALRWSPARRELVEHVKAAQAMLTNGGKDIANAAYQRATPLQMEHYENARYPQRLWPKEFDRNPWEKTTPPGQQPSNTTWQRWELRRDSFHVITYRIAIILRAIAWVNEPSFNGPPYGKNVAPGYHWRFELSQQIVAPDVTHIVPAINARTIRQPTPTNWIHVENGENGLYEADELALLQQKAWSAGLRGAFFASELRDRPEVALLEKPPSDMRLRYWLRNDPHRREVHLIQLHA